MELSTRNSLRATLFHVSDIWQVHEPWKAGLSEEPPGLFIRLSPKVPELQSDHLALGLQLTLGSGAVLPYTLWQREKSGNLVFFVAGGQVDDALLNAEVRLKERS